MSLLNSYYNVNKTRSFLNDFTTDELNELTFEDLRVGANYYASTCDNIQLVKLIETLEDSVYVLSESSSLTSLEESVISCIVEEIKTFMTPGEKQFVKSSAKKIARGAGYLAGLPARVAKGLAYHYGSGYARGRGTNYGARGYDDEGDDGGQSSSSRATARGRVITTSDAVDSSRPSRGFTGSVGIRANLGRSFRMGAAAQRAGTYNQSQTQRLAQQGQRISSAMAGKAPAPRIPNSTPPRPRVTVGGQQQSNPYRSATVTSSANRPNVTGNVGGINVSAPRTAPSIGNRATATTTRLRRNPPASTRVTQNLSEEYVNLSLEIINYLIEYNIVSSIEEGLDLLEELDNCQIQSLTEELLTE